MTKQTTTEEITQRIKNGEKLSIIDVRESFEVINGKIPGAKHIALGELASHLSELDKNEEHVLVCQSGGRSKAACGLLEANGFKTVNMVGGMNDWKGQLED